MNKAGQRASTPTHVDDADLVTAARRGDRDAFRTLYERYHRRAYTLALGVVRPSALEATGTLDGLPDAFIDCQWPSEYLKL